jgi:hypothetical protein
MEPAAARAAWAASGAMALTGRFGEAPLVAPSGVVGRIRALGEPIGVDPLPLLGERSAAGGLTRAGDTTCGGAGRLLRAADGWVAVNLARDDDLVSVPAWLEVDAGDDPWPAVLATVPERPVAELVERATLLGLPVAALGEVAPPIGGPVRTTRVANAAPLDRPPLVVDLSSLWAGPLCARLLADRGAEVVKVESTARPDGARRGPAPFYDRLHAGTASVAVDLRSDAGRAALRALLERADVVIEASRPRALAQLGIDSTALLAAPEGPRVWVSITGYGRDRDRVAFGDDAAVAGGLVADDGRGPCFVADAVADPLTGVAAAAGMVAALAAGGCWLLDVSMAAVAASVAGPDRGARWSSDPTLAAAAPSIPPPPGPAPTLGADNARFGF